MVIPKSYQNKILILQLLSDERKIALKGGYNHEIERYGLSKQQIAERLKLNEKDVDRELDYFWHEKSVLETYKNNNNIFIISPKGFSELALKKYENEGKLLNSQLFNNLSSGFFQIITGIIALYTIYINFTSVETLKLQVESLNKELVNIKLNQAKSYKIDERQNHTSDKKANHQTNVQKSSYKIDTLK